MLEGKTYNVLVKRLPIVPRTKMTEANQPVEVRSIIESVLTIQSVRIEYVQRICDRRASQHPTVFCTKLSNHLASPCGSVQQSNKIS